MSRVHVGMFAVLAAAGLFALQLLGPSTTLGGASAADSGPEMRLTIKEPDGVCTDGVCTLDPGASFTLVVEILQGLADGYILAQSYVDLGTQLLYAPTEDAVEEFAWPGCVPEVAVRSRMSERAYVHGCLTFLVPPAISSMYEGNFIELNVRCSDVESSSEVRLLPFGDPVAVTNGALFVDADNVRYTPKVNDLVVNCTREEIAPPPLPTPRLTWTIDIEPSEPRVGQAVEVTAFASGPGGLPLYRLWLQSEGGLPPLELKSDEPITRNQLDIPVSWELNATAIGELTLQLSVNYEVVNCLPDGGGCAFFFDVERAPDVVVQVGPAYGDVDCDSTVDTIDATLVLQLHAGLVSSLRCLESGDVNGDGRYNSLDAALILQLVAAYLARLPL